MEKYRKVLKPKDAPERDEEIRVTSVAGAAGVGTYVSRAAKLFDEMDKKEIVIKGTGQALTKAVATAEVVKRRFAGLHQITKIGNMEIIDEYEPLEEGLDPVTDVRTVSFIEIILSKDELDTADPGYQPPIDESLVKPYEPEADRPRKGKGKGKGKGGFGKAPAKGFGGKSKGKGKQYDSWGGYGRKGQGKDSWDAPKGYSKGGKKGSWYDWDSYPPPSTKGGGKKGGKGDDWGRPQNYGGGKGYGYSDSKGYDSYGGGYGGYMDGKGYSDKGYGGKKGYDGKGDMGKGGYAYKGGYGYDDGYGSYGKGKSSGGWY